MYIIPRSIIYRLTEYSHDVATSLLFTAVRHFEVGRFKLKDEVTIQHVY